MVSEKNPKTSRFVNKDNQKIYYEYFDNKNPRARILIVHGIGEYSSKHRILLDFLAQNNFDVYAIDLRGFGRSEGRRGHVENFDKYVQDIDELISVIKKQNSKIPFILYGHSLGAVIAAEYAIKLQRNIDGLILANGGFKGNLNLYQNFLLSLSWLVSKIYPTFSMDSGFHSKSEDPLLVKKSSARFANEYLITRKYDINNANKIKIPTLIYHSKTDQIANFNGSVQIYENLEGKEKRLELFKNGKHHINDNTKEQQKRTLDLILNWLEGIIVPNAKD